jgi:nucleotidyltransferase substrate binding protein (TIGR01987 family)
MSDRIQALDNLRDAIDRFDEYLQLPIANDRDKAGTIQGFEFCFELAWKTLQKFAMEMGISVGSPRQSFVYGLREGLIPLAEEDLWLQMLADRNLSSHTYKKKTADDVLSRLPTYLPVFSNFEVALRRKWLPLK